MTSALAYFTNFARACVVLTLALSGTATRRSESVSYSPFCDVCKYWKSLLATDSEAASQNFRFAMYQPLLTMSKSQISSFLSMNCSTLLYAAV